MSSNDIQITLTITLQRLDRLQIARYACPSQRKTFSGDDVKKFAVRILFTLVLAVALLPINPVQSQTAPFKVGDSVEVMYGGTWTTGVVTKGLDSGTYVVNHGTMIMYINQGPANIRAHQMTPAEKAVANQSAQALASRPTGNGIGAQYGARAPATCKSRTALPTAETARQYLLCDMEGIDVGNNLVLLTDLTLQLARSRAFNYNQDSSRLQIDVQAPVYDIRGGFKQYQCGKPILGSSAYVATHNCNLYDQPQAAGSCFRNTFGDWHCTMVGNRPASSNQVKEQMPPR